MNRFRFVIATGLVIGLIAACGLWISLYTPETAPDRGLPIKLPVAFDSYLSRMELVHPFHQLKAPALPGDWLARYPEGGQTFAQYVERCERIPLHQSCNGIDLQPLGDFDETQRKLIEQSAEFIALYFGIPVKTLDPIPLENIPPDARRMRENVEQLLTKWIMKDVLQPRARPDAVATIGLVSCDLWPGNLNWVFGEALMETRVAVWSLYRMGDPRASEESYRLCLLRTVKTAVHEIGHVLGMPHCSEYECGMNGTRSLEEHDRRLLEFCPECQAKIWWTCGADPLPRSRALAEFSDQMNWNREFGIFRAQASALSRP